MVGGGILERRTGGREDARVDRRGDGEGSEVREWERIESKGVRRTPGSRSKRGRCAVLIPKSTYRI